MRRAERLPVLRQLPAVASRVQEDLVLFEAWRGRYADNPRAISEALAASHPELRQCWVLADGVAGPEWAEAVRPGTWRYLSRLNRARWIVTSNNMPGYFRKRRGTTYVQTWHGTPLKRLAYDVPQPSAGVTPRYLRSLRRDVDHWDLLLVQNAFSAGILRSAFRYPGQIAETGYPRNDLLASPAAAAVRERVRAQLGVTGRRVALYAPTWRDGSGFELALERDALERLARDWTVLLRAHPLAEVGAELAGTPGLQDVSGWEDVRELYAAADVLITDYSSSMFDFAVTGKPMLFFTYDLDRYRDVLRGFYFDFERDAPGPLIRDGAGLEAALAGLDAVSDAHAGAYAGFRERFCALDDGRASARAVDAMLGAAR
jgi:CDP-glycerol glycerophosphotransferase